MDSQWREFCEVLQNMGSELIAAAPDDQTRAEGVAYLARLMAYGIERHLMGTERLINGLNFNSPRIGGYNPDYRIGAANLRSGQSCRIRGRMNQAYRIGLGVYSLASDGSLPLDDYKVLMEGSPLLADDGTFDVEIGPHAPLEWGLRTRPTSNLFLAREILLNQDGLRADLMFAGRESPSSGQSFSVGQVEQGMTAVRYFFTGSMRNFLIWTNHFASSPNIVEPLLKEFDDKINGDPGTRYYTGYFDLRDDQALVIEMPDMTCDYWGIMLANHWQEPLPTSFLNHSTARKDSDGKTRIVVAPRDPGHVNWLSTDGRSRGVIWHRRINAKSQELPRCALQG